MDEIGKTWQEILKELSTKLDSDEFNSFLKNTTAEFTHDCFVIKSKSEFTEWWIKSHYKDEILVAIKTVTGQVFGIDFKYDEVKRKRASESYLKHIEEQMEREGKKKVLKRIVNDEDATYPDEQLMEYLSVSREDLYEMKREITMDKERKRIMKIEKAIANAKASLELSGFELKKNQEALVRRKLEGKITEEEFLKLALLMVKGEEINEDV